MSFFDKIKRLFGSASSNGHGDSAPGEQPASEGSGGHEVDMIPCEDALRLVHEYLDGELDDMPQDQVKRHFDVCGRCYPYLRLERSYREAVRRATAGETAPPELKVKVTRLLAEAQAKD